MTDTISPFSIDIADTELLDLKTRLQATRWPEAETPDDWSQGIPLDYTRELARYWADVYDWRATEARLNALPQFTTRLDGLDIHFLHVTSAEPTARPLLLTHGWPGSIIEFLQVIDPLTNPQAHGGRADQAFHVIAPSLPGFGFSGKPTHTGWDTQRIAQQWDVLMTRLGYSAYFAQGGDWGAIVTATIGAQNLGHCRGIHVNMAIVAPDPATFEELTGDEQDALAGIKHYTDWESGYAKQQSTRPQTIGYGLVDSPVAQLAWIVEKFRAWTDCHGHPENSVTRDQLLDNVMLYWLTAAGTSSARIYWESFGASASASDQIHLPAAISVFPHEIFKTSERWARTRFTDLRYFKRHARGGHFAALELPDVFVAEVRTAFDAMDLTAH